jgi:hypothetical protein
VLRRIFESKKKEVTGVWRKLHNEGFHNFYTSSSTYNYRMIKSRRMRWEGYAAAMREKRNTYMMLVGKPEGKRPLTRLRRRWVGNTKMDLREIGWDGMDWIGLAQNRDRWRALVNTAMNLQVL